MLRLKSALKPRNKFKALRHHKALKLLWYNRSGKTDLGIYAAKQRARSRVAGFDLALAGKRISGLAEWLRAKPIHMLSSRAMQNELWILSP
jgi:hypothetical protein